VETKHVFPPLSHISELLEGMSYKRLKWEGSAVEGFLRALVLDTQDPLNDKPIKVINFKVIKRIPHFDGYVIPEFLLQSLFYPGLKFIKPVKLVDLDTLSFEDLVDRVDHLEQLKREFLFFKLSPSRKLMLDDSFKLLRIIMKARKRGSLSFEVNKMI